MRAPAVLVIALVAGTVLSSCSSEEQPTIETATVRSGEVVQTVQAPAQLDAVDRAEVSAPLGGEVEELLVEDGDVVGAGDPLVRLASDSLEAQVEQAEAAVASAEELGAASAGAGIDLGPVIGAFRSQLDTVFPSLLDALGAQIDTTESTLAAAIAGVEEAGRATDALGREVQAALLDAQQSLDALDVEVPELEELDATHPEAPTPGIDASDMELPEIEVPELEVPDIEVPDIEVPELDLLDGAELTAALTNAQAAAADARRRLGETEQAFESASQQLLEAEQELDSQAERTAAAQAAAVEAQVDQAELALDATRSRIDRLEVVAPIDGVVELARRSEGTSVLPGLPGDLGELSDLGGLAGSLGTGEDLGGLLEGDGAGSAAEGRDGPIAEGVDVGAGEPLLNVYDLSDFVARLEVDELDVVQVEVGQAVVIRVDAFPDVELQGRVDHVALVPSRDVVGGAVYPVTVVLTGVPEDIGLRVGLSASAEIEVRRLDGETVVPTSALLRRGDGEVVHVVRDGRAVEVPVELLAIGDEAAAIAGDVQLGEEVVTIGVELIDDGDEVPT